MTFEAYRRKLRLERAKQLLTGTSLGIEQMGQLCGSEPDITFTAPSARRPA